MKYLNLRFLIQFLFAATLFSACKKVELIKPVGDRGQTIVKFMINSNNNGVNYNLKNYNVTSTPQTVEVVDIRRDIPNSTELNKTMVISIKADDALLNTYNSLNGTALVPLPAGSYTVDGTNPLANGAYTVTFNPGEFAKPLKIVLTNPSTLDLSKQYAVALTIVTAITSGDGVVSFDNRSVVVELGPLNKYDGIYSLSGYTLRAGDPARTGTFSPIEMSLITQSGNSVAYSDLQVWADGSGVGIGIPVLTVDPATNLVTVSSPGGATNVSAAANYYDPATKTFHLDFTWGAGPSSRRATVTLKYLRPR